MFDDQSLCHVDTAASFHGDDVMDRDVTDDDVTDDDVMGRDVTVGGAVGVRLEHKDLWDRFNALGTEMVITKSGRLSVTHTYLLKLL